MEDLAEEPKGSNTKGPGLISLVNDIFCIGELENKVSPRNYISVQYLLPSIHLKLISFDMTGLILKYR